MSARLSIFETEQLNSANELRSVCLSEAISTTWKQQNIEYKISGHTNVTQNFADCYKKVLKIIENKLSLPNDLKNKNVYAFSYYYDRLGHSKIINKEGGVVSLSAIKIKAEEGQL
jgi:hypothetical protein